jgi:hypothetical protein
MLNQSKNVKTFYLQDFNRHFACDTVMNGNKEIIVSHNPDYDNLHPFNNRIILEKHPDVILFYCTREAKGEYQMCFWDIKSNRQITLLVTQNRKSESIKIKLIGEGAW